MGCLFILFIVSFAIQQLLSLSRSHLFIFYFISIVFVDRSKKILLQFMSESVLFTFHSGAFLVAQTSRESVCNVKDLGSILG